MGTKQRLLLVGLGWGLVEGAILVFILGLFPGSYRIQQDPYATFLEPFLLGSILIVAVVGGYILADFLESFKALFISQTTAFLAVLSGAVVSHSIPSLMSDLSSFILGLFFLFLLSFTVGLGSSLFGALLGVIMEPKTPFTADSRLVSLGLLLDLAAILPTLMHTYVPWIVFPMIALVVVGFGFTCYGQMRVRMLKPRIAGLLFITAAVVTSLGFVSLLIWNGLYEKCIWLRECEPGQADGFLQIVWVLSATLLTPGFVILGSLFPRPWSNKMEALTAAVKRC